MRLTLRTLLAYLDDTLDPVETKGMGQKVAESEMAGELIERIKTVTRRRGLATPSVDGDNPTSDPNTVSEYLDGELGADEVAEVEKLALESDAHLADIAAAHQILTLALAEPAKVPPTANQRMYRLVKGKEAIPFRKPTQVMSAGVQEREIADTADSEYEFTLPAALDGDRPRWGLLIGLSAVLLGIAGIAIFMAMPKGDVPKPTGYPVFDSVAVREKAETKPKATVETLTKKPEPPKAKALPIITPEPKAEAAEVLPAPREIVGAAPAKADIEVPAPKASMVRQPIGEINGTTSQVLVSRALPMEVVKLPREDVWHRINKLNPAIHSSDRLVAPPGYHPEILVQSGVHLQLWGNLPEFLDLPLLETRAILHAPGEKFDADITLEAGRIFVRNDKPEGAAKVRIRVKEETWEIALLEPKSEIAFDRFDRYQAGVPYIRKGGGDTPKIECTLGLLKGKANVRLGFKEFPNLTGPVYFTWDNKGVGLQGPNPTPDKLTSNWSREVVGRLPGSTDMIAALADLEKRFPRNDDPIDVNWASVWKGENERPARRIVALFGLESIDAITDLVDALGEDMLPVRQAAILALRHWTSGTPERDAELIDVLITKRRFQDIHAEIIMDLLHSFLEEDAKRSYTYEKLFGYLKHERLQIRELAYWHLVRFDPQGAKESGYVDSNGPDTARESARTKWYNSWKKRFDAKKAKK